MPISYDPLLAASWPQRTVMGIPAHLIDRIPSERAPKDIIARHGFREGSREAFAVFMMWKYKGDWALPVHQTAQ